MTKKDLIKSLTEMCQLDLVIENDAVYDALNDALLELEDDQENESPD